MMRANQKTRAYSSHFNLAHYTRDDYVEPGKELVVDTGHLVAFSDDVDYSIGKVGGIRSLISGGEGLVMRFKGSGHVWVQTRNMASLAGRIILFLPGKSE